MEEQGFPKTALRGSRRFGHHVDTILGTKAETVCAPKSALRGRFDFSKNPAPFASPTSTKKISFDLSGVGPGTVTASDDGLQDAEIAAECLGTPRTPGGGRGVMCEWSRNGREFQTALRQTVRAHAVVLSAVCVLSARCSRCPCLCLFMHQSMSVSMPMSAFLARAFVS